MMINCKECGKEMSDSAKVCPNCGYDYTLKNKLAKKKSNKIGCLVILGIMFIFFLIAYNAEPTPSTATTVTDEATIQKVSDINVSTIDSVKVNNLQHLFTEKKDEFENSTWVQPKSQPPYRNQNGAYLYFSKNSSGVGNLRFVMQYAAEDWLFIENVKFIVDGKNFEYHTGRWKTDHDSEIWEWSDQPLSASDMAMIEAIATGKSVKYRLNGSQYYKDKTLSAKYIKGIKNTLEYYKALGGKVY